MEGSTRRAAVLGHPIGHSKSPLLHRAAYGYLGFDCSYEAIDLPEEDAAAFAASLRRQGPQQWAGLSVTMPLKSIFVPVMDRLTPEAEVLQVLNTITFDYTPGGVVLTGHNTDVAGIVGALRHAGARKAPRIAVLGAGGTACAAVAAAGILGAAIVDVYARSFPAAAASGSAAPTGTGPISTGPISISPISTGPISAVEAAAVRTGTPVQLHPWQDAAGACAEADVVICTLPPRAADSLAEALAVLAPDRSGAVLLDVAYDPWPSRIAQVWEQRGGRIVPGLEMLLYQAVEQVRLFSAGYFRDEAAVINVMCDAVGTPQR